MASSAYDANTSSTSTTSSSSRRRSREWLPSLLPSFGLLTPRRTRPLKFQCELTLHALRDYPQSGMLFVKWKDGQGNQGFTPTRPVNTADYSVTWEATFSFLEAFRVDEESNLPLPRMLHLSVRQVNRRTGAVKRVGVVDLNLSELISSGSSRRAFLLRESRFNASLALSLSFKQLLGDPLFRCPLAAKEAEENPSPEELMRPRSFERERLRRESSGSTGSSNGGGQLQHHHHQHESGEGRPRPTSLPQSHGRRLQAPAFASSSSSSAAAAMASRHGYSRSMSAALPAASASPPRQGMPPSSSPLRNGNGSSSTTTPTRAGRSHTLNYGAHVRESAGQHRIQDSLATDASGLLLLDESLRRLSLSRSRGGQQPPIEGEEEEEEEGGVQNDDDKA